MDSFGRLKILKQIDAGETQTYLVYDPERDREVLLHIFPQKRTPENRAVWDKLDAGLEAARKIILDRGDVMGVQFVVTEYIKKSEPVSYLPKASPMPVSKPVGPLPRDEPAPSPKAPPPGEFTQLFESSLARPAPGIAAPIEAPAKKADAGEFTRMFHPQAPAAPIPAAAETPKSQAAPGEFTRLFQGSTTPSTPEPARVEPIEPFQSPSVLQELNETAAKDKGPVVAATPPLKPAIAAKVPGTAEFTRYFDNPLGKGSGEVDFSKKVTDIPKPIAKKPGEFTQMFGRPFSTDSKRQPVDARDASGGATGVFSAGTRPLPVSQSEGPGDYTRMFKAPGAASPVAASASESAHASAPGQKAGIPVVLIAVLGVLLVLAIALVLYFALKH